MSESLFVQEIQKLIQNTDICDLGSFPRENTRNTPNPLILYSERVKYKVMFYLKFVPSWKKKVFQMNWKKEGNKNCTMCTKSEAKSINITIKE